MKWDGFKNRLKKESHEQKQDVDIDAIWAAIEPEVDAINEKDKDRKGFVFWLFFGGILALTTGLFFYVMNGEIEGEIVAAENIEIEIIEKENKKIENSTNNSFRNTTEQNLTKDEEDLIEKTDAKVNSFNSDEIVDSDLNNNSINLPSSISENKNLINSIKGIEEGRRRENKTIIKSGVVSSSNKKENNKITSINNIEVKNDEIRNFSAFNVNLKKEESKLATLSEQEITNSSDGVTQAGSINSTEKEKTQISAALANSILNSRLRKLDLPTLTQAIKASNYFILPTLEELSSPIASKDPKDKDPKGGGDKKSQNSKSKIKWSLQARTGLSYANQTLTQKTPSTSLLLEHRKNYESSLETLHFGFSIAAQHKSGLGLSIGLQRSEITERYTYQDTRSETNMVDAVVTRRINLSNDTIDIMGELPQVTNIIIDKNIYNKYTLLDLPVIVSYHYRLNEFWNIGAEAGLLINLSLKTKGIIPDASLQDVNIDTNQGDVFNSKIGLGYHFGASVGRNIGKKWSLNISPMLRIYPKDFAVDTYELSQKYVLFGGNLGLTYHFN